MTSERIEDFREIVLPFARNVLLKTNYENLGKSDAEEFTRDFNEILDLAIKAIEQKPTTKNNLGVDSTPNTISFKEMMDRLNLTTNDIEKAEDLDFEIESLMPSYSNLLKANNQLKKQIEMLKLDRDCDKPSGKWIANAPQYDMLNPQYICSECGNAHTRITPYCEMCGAKMVEPQESEGKE